MRVIIEVDERSRTANVVEHGGAVAGAAAGSAPAPSAAPERSATDQDAGPPPEALLFAINGNTGAGTAGTGSTGTGSRGRREQASGAEASAGDAGGPPSWLTAVVEGGAA